MKIVVTGPVCTDSYFGGVATFTEGLADAFKLNNNEVIILTDYSNKKETINGVKIISVRDKPARKSIKTYKEIKKEIIKFKPDFVLSSLEYGVANRWLDSSIPTIHYLHAFPSVKRTMANNFFVKHVTRNIVKNSTYTIANSGLTATINGEIFNTFSGSIVNVSIGYEFLDEFFKVENQKDTILDTKKKNILFAGRLVEEKNVDYIIKAFNKLANKDVVLNIVGEGNKENELKKLAQSLGGEVVFHGKVSQKEVVKFYRDTDIFISLNPHEPYGIVYLEALATNTNIVCPKTGGQMDTLIDYKDRVVFINPYDVDEIAMGLREALEIKNEPFSDEYIINNFTYKKAAKEIEEIYLKKIKK
ncbi:MAG: glycosyltransferase family 4 protein [Sarcina sp.]